MKRRKKKSSIYRTSAEKKLPNKVNFGVTKLKGKGHKFGKTILRI
jgi:hypothetical protein